MLMPDDPDIMNYITVFSIATLFLVALVMMVVSLQ